MISPLKHFLIYFLLAFPVFSQVIYKDTVKLGVFFYDHIALNSPGRNDCIEYTEFNMEDVRSTSSPVLGMVQDSLGPDGRPVKKDFSGAVHPSCALGQPGYCPGCGWFNKNMHTWFNEGMGVVKILDSLPFIHKGKGMYEYNNWSFFPLDGKPTAHTRMGGPETLGPNGHNYGFCMMLHDQILYDANEAKNQDFNFYGDDDVWVFVNKKLVLDLGGIHFATNQSFKMSDIAAKLGLKSGESYPFDFFYCERRYNESHIRITTNINIFDARLRYNIIK